MIWRRKQPQQQQASCLCILFIFTLLSVMNDVRHVDSVEYNNDNQRHKNNAIERTKSSEFDDTSSSRHYIRAPNNNSNNNNNSERRRIERLTWAGFAKSEVVVDDNGDDRPRTHFLVRCKGDEPEEQLDCLRDIMSIPGHGVEITRYLETTPYFAVNLPDGESQAQELNKKKNVEYVEEDSSNHYSFEYLGPMESRWDSLGKRRELGDDRAKAEDRDAGRDEGRDKGDGQNDDTQDDEVEKEVAKEEDKDNDKDKEKDDNEKDVGSIFGENDETRDKQQLTYGVYDIRATEVWEEFKDIVGEDLAKGSGAKVCIIDTGARASHEDVIEGTDGSNNMGKDLNWDEDSHGHGTHVLGTINAADNSRGVVGVAPKASVYVVRVFGGDGQFETSALIDAMEECRKNDVDVINMSFGGPLPSKSEEEEFRKIHEKGILMIAAAGNTGTDEELLYPAGWDYVVSVGASKENKGAAHFSAVNSQVNVIAAGVDVRSMGSRSDSYYSSKSGTSMSCPHVTGVAALLFSIFPEAGPEDVREAIEVTAHDDGACGHDSIYGNGHVDAMEAALFLRGRFDGNYTYEMETVDDNCIQTSVSIKAKEKVTWAIRDPSSRFMFRGHVGDEHDEQGIQLPPLKHSDDCYEFVVLDLSGDGIKKGEFSLKWNEVVEIEEDKYEGDFFSKPFGCGR